MTNLSPRHFKFIFFFFSSRRRHTRFKCDWSSDVCSSDLKARISSLKLLIFLATALLFGPWTWAQGLKDPQATLQGKAPFKVAILPVTMHSPENLGYMQEGMLD